MFYHAALTPSYPYDEGILNSQDMTSLTGLGDPAFMFIADELQYGNTELHDVTGNYTASLGNVTWGKDEEGPYLEFNGTNAFLSWSGPSLSKPDTIGIAISCSFKVTEAVSGYIVSQCNPDGLGTHNVSWAFGTTISNYPTLVYHTGSSVNGVSGVLSFAANVWVQGFGALRAGSSSLEVSVYPSVQAYTTYSVGTTTVFQDLEQPILMGCRQTNNTPTYTTFFKGRVRRVVVWRLAAPEVTGLLLSGDGSTNWVLNDLYEGSFPLWRRVVLPIDPSYQATVRVSNKQKENIYDIDLGASSPGSVYVPVGKTVKYGNRYYECLVPGYLKPAGTEVISGSKTTGTLGISGLGIILRDITGLYWRSAYPSTVSSNWYINDGAEVLLDKDSDSYPPIQSRINLFQRCDRASNMSVIRVVDPMTDDEVFPNVLTKRIPILSLRGRLTVVGISVQGAPGLINCGLPLLENMAFSNETIYTSCWGSQVRSCSYSPLVGYTTAPWSEDYYEYNVTLADGTFAINCNLSSFVVTTIALTNSVLFGCNFGETQSVCNRFSHEVYVIGPTMAASVDAGVYGNWFLGSPSPAETGYGYYPNYGLTNPAGLYVDTLVGEGSSHPAMGTSVALVLTSGVYRSGSPLGRALQCKGEPIAMHSFLRFRNEEDGPKIKLETYSTALGAVTYRIYVASTDATVSDYAAKLGSVVAYYYASDGSYKKYDQIPIDDIDVLVTDLETFATDSSTWVGATMLWKRKIEVTIPDMGIGPVLVHLYPALSKDVYIDPVLYKV